MKPLVIYHADCTDGFAAAFAAWLKLGDEAEYLPATYGSTQIDLRTEVRDREVYVLDFSFPRDQMDALFPLAKRVVWLDHHKTAFEMYGASTECGLNALDVGAEIDENKTDGHHVTLDNNKSGALLAWEYFHPGGEAPMLFKHIDDRDRWQFKLGGSKELHAALQSCKPWSFEQWRDILIGWQSINMDRSGYGLRHQGAVILRAQDQHVASMAKQARECCIYPPMPNGGWRASDVVPYYGLACNASLHIDELGHVLATQSGTYALIWYVAQDNKVKCSLRSNGDYDVSAIAKAFGGGGHKNAAGFETDIDTLMGWIV
jgi:uncharacterized protein